MYVFLNVFWNFCGKALEKQKNSKENIYFPSFSLYSLRFSLLFPNFPIFLVPGDLARRLGAAGDPRHQENRKISQIRKK